MSKNTKKWLIVPCLIEKQKDVIQDCRTVLMNFGGNDSDFLWQEISAAPDELHKPKTPIDFFEQTYLKLIERVRK